MANALAIHIGLNNVDASAYGGWDGKLSGCVNDANAMQRISTGLGYSASQILNGDATAAAVLAAIDNAAQGMSGDDILVLTYSGHGGRVPFADEDHPDGMDDTWVLYDRMLLGHELYLEWGKFPTGARIFVLSDSCHSGTVLRDVVYTNRRIVLRSREVPPDMLPAGTAPRDVPASELETLPAPVFRVIPPTVQDAHVQQNAATYDRIKEALPRAIEAPAASVLLISGCQDNQTSQDGDSNGLFTQRLLEVWSSGAFTGDYPTFHQEIVRRMPPEQTPNYFKVGVDNPPFEAQKPFTPDAAAARAAGPSVAGPESASRDGGPPTFQVVTGQNRYYVFEITSDPQLFDRQNRAGDRTSSNFWASWADSDRHLSGPSFTLPDTPWQALRQNDRLYFRVGTTAGPTGWDGYQVSTLDDKGSQAPSLAITGPSREAPPPRGAARSMKVVFANSTDQDLTLETVDLPHGEWSNSSQPPSTIAASATATWQSESAGIMTGTEGSVKYRIGSGSDEVFIHWDNPYAGSNKYDEWASSGWDLFHTGGDGDNATMQYRLAYSQPHAVSNFAPSTSGFHFANSWPVGTTEKTLDLGIVKIALGDASNGLCGGMVYAARDYFEAGLAIPSQTTAPPGEGDPLFDFFFSRLIDSFDLPNLPLTLMKLMDPVYPDTDENLLNAVGLANGRAFVMAKIAWPGIRADIDAGHPSPICLLKVKSAWPGDLGLNHQVLVYGYTLSGTMLTLNIYDPNQPDADDVTMSLDIGRTDRPITVFSSPSRPLGSIYCFFRTAYSPARPPSTKAAPPPVQGVQFAVSSAEFARITGRMGERTGIEIAYSDGRFLARGGDRKPPRPLTPAEQRGLLANLAETLRHPSGGIDVDALRTFTELLAGQVTGTAPDRVVFLDVTRPAPGLIVAHLRAGFDLLDTLHDMSGRISLERQVLSGIPATPAASISDDERTELASALDRHIASSRPPVNPLWTELLSDLRPQTNGGVTAGKGDGSRRQRKASGG